MNARKLFRFGATLAVTAALGLGCAKVPSDVGVGAGRIIEVTMTLRGAVRTDQTQPGGTPTPNYYIVLINRVDEIGAAGPVPVIGVPWGNGFAASSRPDEQGFVGFVVFSTFGGLTGYETYQAPSDSSQPDGLRNPPDVPAGIPGGWTYVGPPDSSTLPQPGERTLRFRLNLNRLPNPDARYLQINFLATNTLPVGADENFPKIWDALGDGSLGDEINRWVTVDVTQDAQYNNALLNTLEPTGDVRLRDRELVDDPSLDIEDWTISVRSQ